MMQSVLRHNRPNYQITTDTSRVEIEVGDLDVLARAAFVLAAVNGSLLRQLVRQNIFQHHLLLSNVISVRLQSSLSDSTKPFIKLLESLQWSWIELPSLHNKYK